MKNNLWTKALSALLAIVMVVGMVPATTISAFADDVSETLVTSLAELYDGDEAKAREELKALYDAGLIESDGSMVSLDIREDGESVNLEDIAKRIADGEEVGELTVNGNAAAPEKLTQLQQVNAMLEVLRLIDKDIEITDEHVANLESLIAGIADGSIDLSGVISRGEAQLSAPKRTMRLLGAGNSDQLPENTGSGEVEATDGKYTAPYISGSSYEESHEFSLNDPTNTTWYTNASGADGGAAATGGVVTLSASGFDLEYDEEEYNTITFTASLNQAQPVPVSFDWTAVSEVVALSGETGGTITWEANDTEDKTFTLALGDKSDYWDGYLCVVVNAGNIKNATFEGGKTAWSQTVPVYAYNQEEITYRTIDLPTNNFQKYEYKYTDFFDGTQCTNRWYFTEIEDVSPLTDDFKLTYAFSKGAHAKIFLISPDNAIDKPETEESFTEPYASYDSDGYSFTNSDLYFSGTETDEVSEIAKNGKVWLYFLVQESESQSLTELSVSAKYIPLHDEVVDVSVPAGTYYSGQTIPITLTMKEGSQAFGDTKLTVNGVECLIPYSNINGKKITFIYTVRETDVGYINVTSVTDMYVLEDWFWDPELERSGRKVELDNEFPAARFGKNEGVIIVADVKGASLDWENVKYGIDDADAGDQTVTAVIPFRDGADKTWVASENMTITSPIPMSVPGYENAKAAAYLKSAYFSTDGGATRYPVYVIDDETVDGEVDALAVRFAPGMNATAYLRKDTVSLFFDTEIGTTVKYLGEWADKKEDAKGFAYFTATDAAAPVSEGKSLSYYVKGGVSFDKDAAVDRPDYDEANKLNGFYKSGAEYVAVQGEDYSKQHDVELWINEAFYRAISKGVRVEDPNTFVLNYQWSERRNFTFTDPKYFTWNSDNEQIATVVKDEQTGAGRIALTGGSGAVTITLTVGNGSESKKYDLSFTFNVLEGKTPFLNIPEFSRNRVTLTETATDVLFSSNVTQCNAAVNKGTTFTAKLYKVDAVGDEPAGEPSWTGSFESTAANTLTHITVPADKLTVTGTYAVVVSTRYEGGVTENVNTAPEELSAAAYLTVKQAPVKVTLKTLDSYSADYKSLPRIEYTVTPSTAKALVEYTIQKSGETVGERKTATDGVIPFAAEKPEGLKEAYTITVYAKAADAADEEAWSVDSMLIRVYNTDMLELIVKNVIKGEIGGTTGGTGENANGTTVNMDNHGKLAGYGITDESIKLTVDDLNALRADMSLQKIISANYGTGVWGLLSDKMQWTSSDGDLVSINYKQGGVYSDIRNFSYTSYGPATDFLLVGKGDTEGDGVTITATHAATGKTASVNVKADTLKDQLYVFQFNPKTETTVTYTNGAGKQQTLTSDENGVLAVYEPEGIASSVMAMSTGEKDGASVTYVGTIFHNDLQSGERDVASLQLYPCNNLRLRSVSNVTLTFRKPDGSAYEGEVKLRAGVYKNGEYCPNAKSFFADNIENKFGEKDDITANLTDGKLTLGFNPTEFRNKDKDSGADSSDKIVYAFEYRAAGYQTGYALVNVSTDMDGEQNPTDSVIRLAELRGSENVPQIIRQTIRQFTGGKPLPYTRDVTDYTENIGLSKRIDKVILTTDFTLPESLLTEDEHGNVSLSGEFELYTTGGRKLTGQTDYRNSKEDKITNLSTLEQTNLFVFPFSTTHIGRHVYTLTDDNLKADGISDKGGNSVASSRIKAMFVRDGMTLTSVTMPFGISNLSNQDPNDGASAAASSINSTLKSKMSIGEVFKSINVNSMLKKGFTFLSGLSASGGDMPLSLLILPTEDPGVFRLAAFVGKNQEKNKGNQDGVKIEYDEDTMYEDLNSLMDDDDDDGGEGSYDVSFSGTLVLEAGYDFNKKEWAIDFRGGKVGLAFNAKYEWSQNFMCGPVPANISFGAGANAVVEVSFASKSSVKLMLVDATIGVYIEAFAGLGFDATIAKLKLGIYGRIGANVNFLLLSDFKKNPSTGTKLDINGEIGIRLEVKVLFVKYKKTFASTGFNWSKKWNKYDNIQERWAKDGDAELFGFTQSGRAYSMRLLSNGKALVTIEGGGEIENRDYLELADRTWNDGVPSGRRLLKAAAPITNALTNVQTNAYPYSNPVLVDDGSMFLYISDNDNTDEVQSVVSYSRWNGKGYDKPKALYDTENAVLADSDVVASGTSGENSKIFAAWVKQQESPDKEMNDKATNDDLGIMMNATEIYAGTYNGTAWTIERLTTNNMADMSPTVASSGNKAIVAWRSLAATEMPAENSEQDFTMMFNAENNVNYSIWNGSEWTDAKVAYNGAAGTVNAIDSAMLSDGTAILVYTVRTGEEITGTETFYTVIDANGDVLTTGRLTNDNYTDTNAQVTAVGNRFVIGWYSEHDTGEKVTDPETGKESDVVAHDIRLARISADGSVDAGFPESIGGGSASAITSDFRFSAPANNGELKNVSIVWSQTKGDDAGEYEINAMRFYEVGGAVGMTAPINIAETDKNFTVDHFDTYTDEEGGVYALVLGSDYSSVEGISAYDSIDLTNLPVVATNDAGENTEHLNILLQEPTTDIKLGAGRFKETAIEVKAETNLYELVPGLDLPVQFTVKNTGASTINKLTVQLGGDIKSVDGVSLLPNESAIVTLVYPVPEDKVEDVDYTVTADGTAENGTLVLNRPDVGISGMKLLSEQDGKRTVQVTLVNASGIPLKGSGKSVKLGLYTSDDHEEENRVGEIITISGSKALADIDDGFYGAAQTINVEDLIDGAEEIPDEGVRLYAYAWVEDCDELYTNNNGGILAFKGLLTKNDGEVITVDTSIEARTENESGVYVVNVDAQNNSLQEQKLGKPVAILVDSEGEELAQMDMLSDPLTLGKEARSSLTAKFTAQQLGGKTPQSAVVDYRYKVTFNTNGGAGTFEDDYTDTNGHLTIPTTEPTPPTAEPELFFAGWYTAAQGGEKITDDYTFAENATVYAHYVTHQHSWVNFTVDPENAATISATCGNTIGHIGEPGATMTINAPTLAVYGGTGSAEATVTNNIEDVTVPTIVYKQGETVLNAAPTDAGTYTASITLEGVDIGNGQTGSVTASVTYTIEKVEIKGILVELSDYSYDADTAPAPALSNEADGNLTLVYSDTTKSVKYYYKATSFLRTELENLDALAETDGVYTELTATTFEPGTHYVLAVISGNNYSNVYTTQSAFRVTKNEAAVRTAPQAPAVEGDTVTVAEEDREKELEYSLDNGKTWLPVTLDENGQFKAESANPIEANVQLREKADENYGKTSEAAKAEEKVTITTITVTYDANGGVSAPEAVKAEGGKTVTVSGKVNMTRKGYTFAGWNTEADGTGTAYKAGDKLSTGLTLYAQWTANAYKVSFNANGGKGSMEEMSFTYDEAQALTKNAFERTDYNFIGWSKSANGSVEYQDEKSVKNLTENGTVTLYAVWAKELYDITGSVSTENSGEIKVKLVQGKNTFGEAIADNNKQFKLSSVPAGTYNLVITQGDAVKNMTVTVADGNVALDLIEMPNGNTSAVLAVSDEAPAIVVKGIDEIAAAEEIDGRKVKVEVSIEAQNEAEAGEAGETIMKESRAQNVEFINLAANKTIYNNGTPEANETMDKASGIIELAIPYDFSGKTGIKLYRCTDGKAEQLTETKDEISDGTYKLDQKAGVIYVYTSSFSTYAITYNNYSSFVSDYETIINDTEHGTLTVEPKRAQSGKKVVITVTPDEGYKLEKLEVKGLFGTEIELTENEVGAFSFTMPNANVTVSAKFAKVKFVDVSENSYYAKAVDWAVEKGITNGVDKTHFAPDATCTRAQAVTFLWRALGCPEPTAAKSEFTDVAEGAFYFKALLWAAENGVTNGYGDGKFGVNDTVNRAPMVTFMERAMKGKAKTAESFTDVPEGAYYADAAAWAKENGISEGIGEGKFGGETDCLRAQIVTMLYRYFVK